MSNAATASPATAKTTVTANIAKTCERLGEVELGGVKLESAEPVLLDVSQLDFNIHVAIQPAAIAYYGSLKKEALRRLSALRRSMDRWEKKKYAEAKASLGHGTGKTTVADIEARYIVDNEAEIQKWETQLDKAQFEYDTLDVWFEAWRQKSFSIRDQAGIEETERFNSSSSIGVSDGEPRPDRARIISSEDRIKNVRAFIRRKREGENP
jgi:hypothetical protein